jgi:hypothetical protein
MISVFTRHVDVIADRLQVGAGRAEWGEILRDGHFDDFGLHDVVQRVGAGVSGTAQDKNAQKSGTECDSCGRQCGLHGSRWFVGSHQSKARAVKMFQRIGSAVSQVVPGD